MFPDRALVERLRTACAAREMPVLDVLWADGGRWWSYLCGDTRCCPPAGKVVDPASAEHLAAELALSGRGVLPNREALERAVAFAPPLGADAAVSAFRTAMSPALDEVEDALRREVRLPFAFADSALLAAVERCAPGGPGVGDEDCVRLVTFLTMRCLRSGGLQWLGGGRHDAAEALWLQLTRKAPPPWGAAPAARLAVYAYARGDGALARVALERALADNPDDVVAREVRAWLDRGLRPGEVVRRVRRVVRRLGGDASG